MKSTNALKINNKLSQISAFLFVSIFIWAISWFMLGALSYIIFSNENILDFIVSLVYLTKYIIASLFVMVIVKTLYCLFYSLITKDWSLFKNIEFSSYNNYDHSRWLRHSREWDQKRSDDFHRQRTDFAYSYSPTNIHYKHD
jgi:hypothetical protein